MTDGLFDDKAIETAQARMESKRSAVDGDCGEIATILFGENGSTGTMTRQEGASGGPVFDEYPAQAHQDGVSVAEGFSMPRGQKWQKIRIADEGIMASVANLQWLETVEDRLFALRSDPESGFVSAVHQSWESLLAFWGQCFWVDKRYDAQGWFAGFSYQSEDVFGVWVERDAAGNVMRVHRKIVMTAEQIVRRWKDKAPKLAREAMAGSAPRPSDEFEILHVIERNDAMVPDRLDAAGKPWRACYYSVRDKARFDEGGYRTLRRIVSSYARRSERDYGSSPAMRILQAMRGSQLMMQDRVLGVEYNAKGSWLTTDDALDEGIIDLSPDGITVGGLDDMGNPVIQQLARNTDMNGAENLHAELRSVIDKAFFRDLLQINREQKTHVTALRTAEEIGEKGVLLAPLARQEQEWFAPMLAIELDLMWEEGLLDDMPPAIAEFFARGGGVTLKYENSVNQMMEAAEAAGYLRTAEQVASIASFDPSIVPAFTREYPLSKVLPGLGNANGIPAKWRATEEERAEAEASEAARAQIDQLLQAAPALASAGKDLAAAGAMGSA